jgi:GAF domain-containing protein
MSTVADAKPAAGQNLAEISRKLEFQRKLQAVTNKIHATANVDEIMLELSQDICELFDADRLTIYTVAEDKSAIVSKVKVGLSSFKDLKLPLNDQSIAGFVGLNKKLVNIRDVYDEEELRGLSPSLRFLKEVDRRTGYRTKQMLVVPILEAGSGELIGVVQIINSRNGDSFGPPSEEGAVNLCETLAIALKQRQRPAQGAARQVRRARHERRALPGGDRTRHPFRPPQGGRPRGRPHRRIPGRSRRRSARPWQPSSACPTSRSGPTGSSPSTCCAT